MIRELERHGYRLSPGTMYPILHGLEERGYLSSTKEVVSGKMRKYYRITILGEQALKEAKERAHELLDELEE